MESATYAAPTPRVFYIHDDLTDYVRQACAADSPALPLTAELFRVVRRQPQRVVVLHLDDQMQRLLAQGRRTPFAATIGIGQAGERVARQLHARAGWFPSIRRVEVAREEDGRGGYRLVSPTPVPLEEQLRDVASARSLAIVDDTVFSGFTMRAILHALPAAVRPRTEVFCLRGIAASLASIRALCPVSVGFAAPGRILEDVSFINATGLVLRVGIRRAGHRPMAFFERRTWMEAWFPGYAEAVIDICQRLNALLEPPTPETR